MKGKELKFEILNYIGVISEESRGWKKELNRVIWNSDKPKYDLRAWGPEHKLIGKGITLTEEELRKLKEIIDEELKFLDE